MKLSSIFHTQTDGQMKWINQVLEQYLWGTTNYHQNNWLELLAMVEFAYNNIVHWLTQQTHLFTNHGLHPKFDIQGVHKVVTLTTQDRAMWLVNVQSQLVSNLGKTQKRYKDNVNEHRKEQLSFKVGDQIWLWWQHIKTTRPLEKLNH
jgi:hypothetical protein